MAVAWAGVRAVLLELAQGRWLADHPTVAADWRAFAVLYREHIALEESQAFPLARALIGAEDLRAMAGEMARRRGVR